MKEFLKKAWVFYLATADGDQPRVRPFGAVDIFDGKLADGDDALAQIRRSLDRTITVRLLAVLGFFPEEPVFTLAEVHDEDKRDLAGGRKILVSSDAHRLWEISDGSFCVHLDVDPEAGEEAIRKALFAMLEKKS